MGQLFEESGIPEEKMIRGDHKTGITPAGKVPDLFSKVPPSRCHYLIPAPLETTLEHAEHCGTFRGKPGVMCHGILSKKYLHYQIIGPGSDL
jgi:hypothetical protein